MRKTRKAKARKPMPRKNTEGGPEGDNGKFVGKLSEKSPAKRASLNAVVGPACAEESIADGLIVRGNADNAAIDVKPDAPKTTACLNRGRQLRW
jgi:hypothetical protein